MVSKVCFINGERVGAGAAASTDERELLLEAVGRLCGGGDRRLRGGDRLNVIVLVPYEEL